MTTTSKATDGYCLQVVDHGIFLVKTQKKQRLGEHAIKRRYAVDMEDLRGQKRKIVT
jgi:hypothetical protein